MLGLPGNMKLRNGPIRPFFKFLLNNVGDPSENSNYRLHSKWFEKRILNFFASLYGLRKDEAWGYVTTGGTEGNMHGLLAGREKYPEGILYFSKDAHYSIVKIAKILRMKYCLVASSENGEMDYLDLEKKIRENISSPVIINANIGTTFKGAIDSIEKILSVLKKLKVKKTYLHCDAALFGGFIPYVIPKTSCQRVNFTLPINSISISGHKFIGCPMPCGIFLMRKSSDPVLNSKIKYIATSDTTISGSRNGHTALMLWFDIAVLGRTGFKKLAVQCLENAIYLKNQLETMGKDTLLNPFSNIVVFDKPEKRICEKWQLSVVDNKAHIVVMPHVSKSKINQFLSDLRDS